ncbi:hypothetical protein XELAEV_18031444mg [Xenopus laevis]|uniref:HAT C-terminal dimerisation domain-containing protein n=1 Tax=Xenopus laevis TaxID=8355 RepID=A0A974HFQ8_XENLA|nr:hypothetical protein XELAEV_18031444mg [Xenopus laevis]
MFGHPDNGNFMGVLEVISEFDPFLKKHIEKFGNAAKGKPSYLSSTTCLEFIELMGERIVSDIIDQIKIAKYFSIIVDSTPDVTHTDQLTFIVRYVSLDGCIEESFLKFLPILSHTGESLFHSVLTTLDDMGLDIRNCRGQCYDNAANMSGAYNGLQARIKEHNPLVEWVPSGLQPNINNRIETLKTLCNTRWSAHAQATKALTVNYANIHESLNNIADDLNQNLPTRDEAKSLCKKMEKLENAFVCVMSLKGYVAGLREEFDNFEKEAKEISSSVSQQYKVDKQRQRKRKKHSDEAAETECIQKGRERFRTCVFLAVIDRFVDEMDRRYQSYSGINHTFGFLNNISSVSSDDLHILATNLQKKYTDDLEDDFANKIFQLREFLQGHETTAARGLLQLIRQKKLLSVFPNVDIALRLFMTLPVTNASGERSFSKLSLIKNKLRSTTQQSRLNHLALMSIESDVLQKMDFTSLIKEFSVRKARKKTFN